jgi:DNA/RNA endonuclease YhcR with UshA esterase domain
MRAQHFIAFMSFLIVFTVVAQAQSSWRPRNYDPSSETTVKGTIEQVKQVSGRHVWNGTHLMLKTEVGSLDVHAGPSSFISSQGFSFAQGDEVEVLGSKVKVGENEALIAREIKKEDKKLVLRNAQGVPQWAGGRRAK